jgi:hypothetical protein
MDFDGSLMMNFRYLFIYLSIKLKTLFDKHVFFNIKLCVYGIFF